MENNRQKRIKRQIRHNRVRAKISGTGNCPRLSIFRSTAQIYGQLIDDSTGKTLVSASSLEMKKAAGKVGVKGKKSELAKEVGKLLAQKSIAANIKKAVFDRGGYAYHGRVKAFAEGAREGGLEF